MQTKSIMVIDDDRAILDMIAELLSDEGYPVIALNEGRAGVERAKAERPGLILLDLMMPEMNGWQVVDALRALPETHDIPVVLISARRDLLVTAQSLNVPTFLEKPFEVDDMLTIVRSYVEP